MDTVNWHTAPVPWTLWPHQDTAVKRLTRAFFEQDQRKLLCACPTGGGKTIIAIEMIRAARALGMRCMFMAPRHELIAQVCKKFDTFAPFSYGKIVSDKNIPRSTYAELQIAALDTLVSRIIKRKNLILPPIDFVVMDEAHLYMTELRVALADAFGPNVKILGLSATPGRHDGRGLGSMFEHIIKVATVRELTEQGFLVPVRYYGPSEPDLAKIKIVAGEYSKKGAAERMEPLLGDIPAHWLKLAPDRRTAVFAMNVGQSVYLADEFRRHGVSAEHADGSMDDVTRDGVFDRLRSGETQVLCNVGLATYGFDLPELSCIVDASPTKSVVNYLQKIGRGIRRADGKEDCIYIDHSGNWHEHGRVTDERHWSLSGYDVKTRKGRKAGSRVKNQTQLCCPKCTLVFTASLTCPDCGYYFEAKAKRFKVIDGDLVEIAADKKRAGPSEYEQRKFFCELKGYVEERNAKNPDKPWQLGWASHCFKEKFGAFPPKDWVHMVASSPSIGTRRWIQHRNIARAKAFRKQQAVGA